MTISEPPIEAVVIQTQTVRTRSVRGNIIFAFAAALVLAVAYLMREILLLLYVSALFAVVLTPVIRGIMRLHIGRWHPGRGLSIDHGARKVR